MLKHLLPTPPFFPGSTSIPVSLPLPPKCPRGTGNVGVMVSSSHIVSAAPSSSGGGLLTLFPCSSVRSLSWETVLHKLLQHEFFPWAAALHELLQCASFPQDVVLHKLPVLGLARTGLIFTRIQEGAQPGGLTQPQPGQTEPGIPYHVPSRWVPVGESWAAGTHSWAPVRSARTAVWVVRFVLCFLLICIIVVPVPCVAVLLNCPYPDPPVSACFFPFSSAPRRGEGRLRGAFVAGGSQNQNTAPLWVPSTGCSPSGTGCSSMGPHRVTSPDSKPAPAWAPLSTGLQVLAGACSNVDSPRGHSLLQAST